VLIVTIAAMDVEDPLGVRDVVLDTDIACRTFDDDGNCWLEVKAFAAEMNTKKSAETKIIFFVIVIILVTECRVYVAVDMSPPVNNSEMKPIFG